MQLSYLISTFFYLGKIKFFPGSIASLATLFLWNLLVPENLLIRLIILFIIAFSGHLSIKKTLPLFKEEDPQCIVVDEVLGMSIPLLLITNNLLLAILAFFLFRLFDILKPSIIYYSQDFQGPIGILIDDILSGIITALIIVNYI